MDLRRCNTSSNSNSDVNNDDNKLPPFTGAIVTTQLDSIQSL